jgi:Cu+-exporting ATPase
MDRSTRDRTLNCLHHGLVAERNDMEMDPVCGMEIEVGDAYSTVDHEGLTYYFCSEECEQQFQSNPDPYV